ncbi:MAG TPA: Hint domain-containing protein, partial [Xanthobacteraceae bacterium]
MNPNEHMNPSEQERTSKRNFLTMGARNVLAIGVLAASAVAARTARAAPDCDGDDSCSCFLAGTKIKTVSGERKVEDLAIGDLLPTVFGGIRPIQWIGFYRYKKSDPSKPWPKDTRPIRIVRSALADDVPHSDLYVTQRHLLLIDDVLVPAGRLLNATTITRHAADEHDELKYFHIKLETHDV